VLDEPQRNSATGARYDCHIHDATPVDFRRRSTHGPECLPARWVR
jgi:hypothetical protein